MSNISNSALVGKRALRLLKMHGKTIKIIKRINVTIHSARLSDRRESMQKISVLGKLFIPFCLSVSSQRKYL